MDEIILDITKMPREQAIEEIMRVFHLDRADAEFHVAIEFGEIEGDLILVDSENTEDSAYSSLDSLD